MRVLALLSASLTFGACSYDWTVAPLAGDASTDGAASDAGMHDGAADAVVDAAVDVAVDAPSNCDALLANIASVRGAAKTCTLPDPQACTAQVTDECGCKQIIGGTSAATQYKNALAAYAAAQCPKPQTCAACGAQPMPGLCVAVDGGLACSQ